jgi:hypothetical protein
MAMLEGRLPFVLASVPYAMGELHARPWSSRPDQGVGIFLSNNREIDHNRRVLYILVVLRGFEVGQS